MTKNAVSTDWDFTGKAPSGNYESSNRDGDEVYSIEGSGFGVGPTVQFFAKWTDGLEGVEVSLSSQDIGDDFDTGSYNTGLLPKYYTIQDSTGASLCEGGETTETNRLTGFVRQIPNFTEYLISYDTGVPEGRTFSSESTENTLPFGTSCLKMCWLSDEPLDVAGLADQVAITWVGPKFNLAGNNAPPGIDVSDKYDFSVWNAVTVHQKAGDDPFLDNGLTEIVYTVPSQGTLQTIKTDAPTFANATNAYYNHVSFPGWRGNGDQSKSQHLFRYGYLAVGDNSRARIELGDNSVYTSCTARRVVPHTSWSDTNVTISTDSKQRNGMTHWFITNADGVQQSGSL